ncbi:hypothetical protein GCM10010123_41920 [Pilimelia anulata]|uniref:Calcineurin-like phosphoesterase domain-containing protein n=1 Tax=Pilimelia anulata TaxID=53371 RepID=A0A8J3BAN3_9ACTN|nr:metallophosphoesterase [Pilimelia anulata]GGK07562.1 hypothetical protein GCM10010123_41920 [Pilimelia anulata]
MSASASANRLRPSRARVAAALGYLIALGTVPLLPGSSAAQSGAPAAPDAIDEVTQLAEPGAVAGRADAAGRAGTTARQVCQPGAAWLRVRFAQLDLAGTDTVTVTGAAGPGRTYTGRNWPGRAFHTQAFPGDCVTVAGNLSDPASAFRVDAFQAGRKPPGADAVTVAAVGDLCGSSCNQTAPLVSKMNPAALLLAGDIAYGSGTASEYQKNYDPHYGKFKAISYPALGNHDYSTASGGPTYDYFGKNAGTKGQGWYAVDIGDWRFYGLNSNTGMSASSAQVTWLKKDLAANTKPCVGAFWHHPRFSGSDHGDQKGTEPMYKALYDAKADLVIVGHDHNYQRFAPADPTGKRDDANGIVQLLIGTGGRGYYSLNSKTAGPRLVANDKTLGVGQLTLTGADYRADFVPVAGRTFTDTVSGKCHGAQPPTGTFDIQPRG